MKFNIFQGWVAEIESKPEAKEIWVELSDGSFSDISKPICLIASNSSPIQSNKSSPKLTLLQGGLSQKKEGY